MDKIIIKNLRVKGHLGASHWQLDEGQMLIFNITGYLDFKPSDNINDTVSYFTISEHIQLFLEQERKCKTLERLADIIALDCLELGLERVMVQIEKSHALLHADTVGIRAERMKSDIPYLKSITALTNPIPLPYPSTKDIIFIKNLQINCIIGVNTFERIERQRIILNLDVYFPPTPIYSTGRIPPRHNYRTITQKVTLFVEQSSYKTIEMMAHDIANIILYECNVEKVTVKIEKPSALMFADTAGVEITRTKEVHDQTALLPDLCVAYLAIGTNIGNRVKNIEQALSMLHGFGIDILDTSFLYETAPMYVTDQPSFLNACVKVRTNLKPLQLLDTLKQIETAMGRDFGEIRNGPRIIDLDILFYENIEMNHERLQIPHPRIQERFFVLEPLTDIAADFHHPTLFRTIDQLLKMLQHSVVDQEKIHHSTVEQDKIHRVFPVRNQIWNFESRTFVMGILNTTPDSFSDGGKNYRLEDAVENAMRMIEEKVDIIDIGGQSTRPNAPEITAKEEIERVVPVIKAIREKDKDIPISLDTFRAEVAKAAMEAGADLINDVSGGSRDPEMLQVMKDTRAPVCLMHMRGTSSTMMNMTQYKGDLVTTIREELTQSVNDAIQKGIFRWKIMIDPGIGFAKNLEQNFELLRRLRELGTETLLNLPILVGVSRKGFIGKVTERDVPQDRVFGTAAANTIAIMNGANVIRVHDIKEMRDVLLIADKSK